MFWFINMLETVDEDTYTCTTDSLPLVTSSVLDLKDLLPKD